MLPQCTPSITRTARYRESVWAAMHLLVTVKCGQRESRFRIPCGNGQKTFKWLGLVSAARYSSESPKGSLRMRESRQAQAAGTALIPSNITTSDTSFFHPEALLGEQLEDGAEVHVVVSRLGDLGEFISIYGYHRPHVLPEEVGVAQCAALPALVEHVVFHHKVAGAEYGRPLARFEALPLLDGVE